MFAHLKRFTAEEGQSLIQVSISLVVMLAFVALAIDVGRTYGERRQMQNAADAGALAGARELCLGNTEAAARAKASEYMVRNGVAAGAVSAADVAISGNVVDTTARTNVSTLIGQVVDWAAVDVKAGARAACGAATSACGLWPIAFSESIWRELRGSTPGACVARKIAVWADNNDTQAPSCVVGGQPQYNICHCYDCDLNDDGKDDFAVVTTQGRAWLDFTEATAPYVDQCTASGCGASELGCYLRYDAGAKLTLETCVSGDNGVKAGVRDDIISRSGEPLSIALYDGMGCTMSSCPGGNTYHISSFGCIDVAADPWEQNLVLNRLPTPTPVPTPGPTPTPVKGGGGGGGGAGNQQMKGKIIWVYVDCANKCMTACGGTDGTVPEPWQLKAVSLIK